MTQCTVPAQDLIEVFRSNDDVIELHQHTNDLNYPDQSIYVHVRYAPLLVMAIIEQLGGEGGAVSQAFAAYKKRIEELETICAESQQVIGALASEHGEAFEHPDVQKALDNCAEQRLVHQNLLPFPKTALPAIGKG